MLSLSFWMLVHYRNERCTSWNGTVLKRIKHSCLLQMIQEWFIRTSCAASASYLKTRAFSKTGDFPFVIFANTWLWLQDFKYQYQSISVISIARMIHVVIYVTSQLRRLFCIRSFRKVITLLWYKNVSRLMCCFYLSVRNEDPVYLEPDDPLCHCKQHSRCCKWQPWYYFNHCNTYLYFYQIYHHKSIFRKQYIYWWPYLFHSFRMLAFKIIWIHMKDKHWNTMPITRTALSDRGGRIWNICLFVEISNFIMSIQPLCLVWIHWIIIWI